MSEHLIPDIFRLVLEYSAYVDRKVWNYPEDTDLIYECILINNNNICDISRMTNITIDDGIYGINFECITDQLLNIKHLTISEYYTDITNLDLFPNITDVYILGNDNTISYIVNRPDTLRIHRDIPEYKKWRNQYSAYSVMHDKCVEDRSYRNIFIEFVNTRRTYGVLI